LRSRILRGIPGVDARAITVRGAVISLLLWASGSPIPAAAAECPTTPARAEVTVRVDRGTVAVASGRPDFGIDGGGRRFTGTGRRVGGVTHATFHSGMRVEVATRPLDGHRVCATPTTVELDIGYPEFAVTIDGKYAAGTCEYRALLNHENTHVTILRRTLDRFAPRVRARLAEAVARFRPIVVTGDKDAADAVLVRLQRDIDPVIKALRDAANAANGAIDTEKSYAAVTARCGNW